MTANQHSVRAPIRRAKFIHTLAIIAAAAIGPGAGAAQAATLIDFNSLEHGEEVTDQYLASHGLSISAVNYNRSFDYAVAFDSNQVGTADPDLEGPDWSTGSLAPMTNLGSMLIIQENTQRLASGLFADPDDEGNRPAGKFIFEFTTPIDVFGFDLIDVEGADVEAGKVSFFLGGALQSDVTFADLMDSASAFFNPVMAFGDHSANRIAPMTATSLRTSGFDRVEISMGGSGAIDNLVIPEPATIALAGVGLLVAVRRPKSRRTN